MSLSIDLPGVANNSAQVGRNPMDHPAQLSVALVKNPIYPYRSPLSTSGSTFPTSACVNPSLTIAALALRSINYIKKQVQE